MKWQRMFLTCIIAGFLLIGLACRTAGPRMPSGEQGAGSSGPESGKPVPGFALQDLAGRDIAFPEAFKGRSVMLVFFSPG